jgi:hypothetical protein
MKLGKRITLKRRKRKFAKAKLLFLKKIYLISRKLSKTTLLPSRQKSQVQMIVRNYLIHHQYLRRQIGP